jgi:transcriptional regulator with XRE-family HTH domain
MVKRTLDWLGDYPARMREKSRSEYGSRLVKARRHAGLTQTALAKAVGMSQSAYAGAETTGNGSTYTSQLAVACGVRADWLATGHGDMLGPEIEPQPARPEPDQISAALRILAEALQSADKATRTAVAPLLSLLALEPDQAENVCAMLTKLLPSVELAHASQEDKRTGRQFTTDLPTLESKESLSAKRIQLQNRGRT